MQEIQLLLKNSNSRHLLLYDFLVFKTTCFLLLVLYGEWKWSFSITFGAWLSVSLDGNLFKINSLSANLTNKLCKRFSRGSAASTWNEATFRTCRRCRCRRPTSGRRSWAPSTTGRPFWCTGPGPVGHIRCRHPAVARWPGTLEQQGEDLVHVFTFRYLT